MERSCTHAGSHASAVTTSTLQDQNLFVLVLGKERIRIRIRIRTRRREKRACDSWFKEEERKMVNYSSSHSTSFLSLFLSLCLSVSLALHTGSSVRWAHRQRHTDPIHTINENDDFRF
jgi:hypothetical protein